MPPNPDLALFDPGKAEIGHLRPPAAAGARRRRFPPPPRAQNRWSRPIRNQRSRLDRSFIRSKPLDPGPAAHVRGYRFGRYVLHKSPSITLNSTRHPSQGKSNYVKVRFLALNTLSFLNIKPAVQPLPFCMLALVSNLYLRFSPQFCPETPWNLVFLADKPLELVFSLDYAF